MKQFIQSKLLLIILIILLFSNYSQAQISFDTNINKTNRQIKNLDNVYLKFKIDVLVDQKETSDSTTLTIHDLSYNVKTVITVGKGFILYLAYNVNYDISFNKPNSNTKVIYIDTDAPYSNWIIDTSVNLQTSNCDIIKVGGMRYNLLKDTFEKYKL